MAVTNEGMSIVMPLSFFPRDSDDQVPRFVEDQIHAFLRADPSLRITVLVPHHGPGKKDETRDGFRIKRFHYFWPWRLERLSGAGIMPAIRRNPWLLFEVPFLFFFEFVALLRIVKGGDYSYIYAHWFTPQGVVASLVSRLTGVPFGFTSHSSDVEVWERFSWLGRKVVRSTVPKANAVTVVSRRSVDKIKRFFDDEQWRAIESRVATIPMGVNVSDFQALTVEPATLKERYDLVNTTVLFFIGRLVEKKGLNYLLEAFATLANADDSLRLVIAGEGQLKEELVQLAGTLGISGHVSFVGFVSGSQKAEYFRMADVVLVPSVVTAGGDAEGLPVSLMEGMAAGTVCVATRTSGADDIVTDGVDGLLIEDRSVGAIVDAVSRVLAMSSAERDSMQSRATTVAMSLDWDVISKRHLHHLFGRLGQ